MLIRVVKMTFQPACVQEFLDMFDSYRSRIRNAAGCSHLELWKDTRSEGVFFTYSHWQDEESLENYRKSDLFREVWPKTKAMFGEKAAAWTVERIE